MSGTYFMPDDDPYEKQPKQACPHLKPGRLYLYICVDPKVTKDEAQRSLTDAVMGSAIIPGVDPLPDWSSFHLCARHPLTGKVFWTVGIEEK